MQGRNCRNSIRIVLLNALLSSSWMLASVAAMAGRVWAQDTCEANVSAEITRLRDKGAGVEERESAARSLSHTASCGAGLSALLETLEDKTDDARIRRSVIDALVLIHQEDSRTGQVIAVLVKTLANYHVPEDTVRAAAARAIGTIIPGSKLEARTGFLQLASPTLVAVLTRPDPDPMVRANAAWALGQLGEDSSGTVAALINTVKVTNVNVGEAAALSLIRMYRTAVPELRTRLTNDHDANFRWKVAWILGEIGRDARSAVQTLAAIVNNTDEDPNVRGAAAWAIGRIGRDAKSGGSGFSQTVLTLTGVLSNEDIDPNVRSNAAWALGRLGPDVRADRTGFPEEVTAALQHGLGDPNADIRRNAAWALGQISPNPEVAGAALATSLVQDRDSRVRVESAAALGQIGPLGPVAKKAVAALGGALNDDELAVRGAAAVSLGELGADAYDALNQLISVVKRSTKDNDDDRNVARATADALVKIAYALELKGRTDVIQRLVDAARELKRAGRPENASQIDGVAEDLTSLRLFNQLRGTLEWIQRYRIPILAICIYALLWFFLYWRFPLTVFRINDAMKPYLGYTLPKALGGIPLSYLVLGGLFHYRPRVLDAWVAHNIGTARRNFQKKPTVQQRLVHVELPVFLNAKPVSRLSAADLRPSFEKDRNCVLICGEGGAGKTSLACEICNWAMSESEERLTAHLMIPVLLEEENLEENQNDHIVIQAAQSELWFLLESAAAPSAELVDKLLKNRRVLVVVDGLSEMSEEKRRAIRPSHPGFAARALVATSRLEEAPMCVDSTLIRPMRIQRDHLSTFMEAYLVQRNRKELFSDSEYFDDLGKLSRMAGEREVTVLLAKLYAEQMIGVKETPSSARLPENIPDLMLQYLNELNRGVKPHRLDDRFVHKSAKVIAWECLKETFRPTAADLERVDNKLGENRNVVSYLEDHLRVVQTTGAGRDRIRFTLDPLAEYLAALQLLEDLKGDEEGWRRFLAHTDATRGEPQAIRGFLAAVQDCCLTKGVEVGVPRFVPSELTTRVTMSLPQGNS